MVKLAMLRTLRVREVMTEAIVLLRTHTGTTEAWEQLHRAGIQGAPVLDDRGRLAGVLSMADLADPRRRAPLATDGTVGDAMTRVVYAVRADDPVVTAIRLMLEENIHRAVVVNDDGSLAGIVVPMDILRALVTDDDGAVEYFDLRKIHGG